MQKLTVLLDIYCGYIMDNDIISIQSGAELSEIDISGAAKKNKQVE